MSRLYVFAPISGAPKLAGRIDWSDKRGAFRYSPDWLARTDSYPLDPRNLPLREGPVETTLNHGVHGVLADAGPDDWGRKLIEHERGPAAVHDPLEVLRLTNGSGTGALLFSQSRERPAPARAVIADVQLTELEQAARTIAAGGRVSDRALQLVYEHGSSLGGARPKALVASEGSQWIAKFARDNDALDIPRLEWACLSLAREAGIAVPEHRLLEVNARSVLLVKRFDRIDQERVHYLSLHALLSVERMSAADVTAPHGMVSYFGAAALYRQIGVPDPGPRLFQRMVFNLLIGNTDDHARNHGLLFRAGQWDMTPAFDLVAIGGGKHALGLGLDGRSATIENALSAVAAFGVTADGAARVVDQIRTVLGGAESRLRDAGMAPADRDLALGRMLVFRSD